MITRSCVRLITAVLAATALGVIPAAPVANAANPTFYSPWPGDVRIFYKAEFAPPVQQDVPPVSVSSAVSGLWSSNADSVCTYLGGQLPSGSKVNSCSISPDGDLQAAMLTPQQFDLRWVVTGNTVSADVPAPSFPCGGSITLHLTFDIWMDLIIDVGSTISPGAGSDTPLALVKAPGTIHNANVSTNNVCGIGGALQSQVQNGLDSTTIDLLTVPKIGDQLTGQIGTLNTMLHLEATTLAGSLPPDVNYFYLATDITAINMDITYSPGSPPPPPGAGGPLPPECNSPNDVGCPKPHPTIIPNQPPERPIP